MVMEPISESAKNIDDNVNDNPEPLVLLLAVQPSAPDRQRLVRTNGRTVLLLKKD